MSSHSIVKIPHPSLRQTATPISEYSQTVANLADSLVETLLSARRPRGVGLASTQIDANKRMFATLIHEEPRLFVNPVITSHSPTLTLGADPSDPDLEGCLSIPKLYGPVPRFHWIELEFQEIDNQQLVPKRERFEDFPARVIQHERDHLDGILFLDYSLEYDLPVFENVDTLIPVPKSIIATMIKKSWEKSETNPTK